MSSGALGGLDIGACKHGGDLRRSHRMLERQGHAGARLARGASADRIHHDHQRAGCVRDGGIDIGRGAEFFDAQAAELFAHGRDKRFRIRHAVDYAPARWRRWTSMRSVRYSGTGSTSIAGIAPASSMPGDEWVMSAAASITRIPHQDNPKTTAARNTDVTRALMGMSLAGANRGPT